MIKAAVKTTHGMNLIVLHTKPFPCGGNCRYCFSSEGLNSGMLHSETLVHARDNDWSSTEQMRYGMALLDLPRPTGNKFSLAIKGNSFTNYPMDYLELFFKGIYDFLNGEVAPSFEEARRKHATAPNRCGSISVSTRPDMISEAWCRRLIRLGVSSVDLGVQNLCDAVLAFNNRGHGSAAVLQATGLLKEYGFEVGYHMMPGLPAATWETDAPNYTHWLWNHRLFPDYIKLYPCILLKDSAAQPELAKLFHSGQWQPLTDAAYAAMLDEILPFIPRSTFISRFQRIIPEEYIAGGPARRIDRSRLNGRNRCIYQRSFQHTSHLQKPFSALEYHLESVPQGADVCIQALLPDDTVLAYSRLSFFGPWALLRDLRVLGRPFVYGDHRNEGAGCIQHKGIGKAILARAEADAKERNCREIRIYPIPGSEHYFLKQGYREEGDYSLRKRLG